MILQEWARNEKLGHSFVARSSFRILQRNLMSSILLRGGTIISGEGMRKADVLVEEGVVRFEVQDTRHKTQEERDVTGKLLFPGFIDCHVHFREPGLEHKATMKSESEAAMAGGVTTVCEMPNTIPPTVTVAALADKVRRAESLKKQDSRQKFDMRFFFGITEEIHLATLRELLDSSSEETQRLKKYLCGVKLYLDHSTGDQKVHSEMLDDIFKACAEHNIVIVAHCEDPAMNTNAAAQNKRTDIAAHSLIRPAESESAAIDDAISLAKKHGTQFHVAHLSTERGLHLVRQAKADGLPVTCEVAPHHLFFTTDDYEKLGTLIKMNPPIRSREHVEALWQGIADRTVDCISTDHAPHTLEEKRNNEPLKAPSGVPGVETMIPLLLSVSAGHWPHHRSGHTDFAFSPSDIHRLCFANPNRIFSLGREDLTDGARTPVVVVDPAAEWQIKGSQLHSLCGWTPYEGWRVKGAVVSIV